MPMYIVTEEGQPERLVNAASASSAVRYVTQPRIQARRLTNPTEVADIMERGVKLERVESLAEGAGDGE